MPRPLSNRVDTGAIHTVEVKPPAIPKKNQAAHQCHNCLPTMAMPMTAMKVQAMTITPVSFEPQRSIRWPAGVARNRPMIETTNGPVEISARVQPSSFDIGSSITPNTELSIPASAMPAAVAVTSGQYRFHSARAPLAVVFRTSSPDDFRGS